MRTQFFKNRIFAGIAIGLAVAIFISTLTLTQSMYSWHLKIADTLYGKNNPSDKIVIIGIDTKSTMPAPNGLGRFAQWSRNNYVKLLDILKKENPKVIAADILFNTPTQMLPFEDINLFKSTLEKNATNSGKLKLYEDFLNNNSRTLNNSIDQKFADKLKEFKNIVLAFNANNNTPIYPLKKFSETATLGNISVEFDKDNILRKTIPYFKDENENKTYDDFAIAAAKIYLNNQNLNIPNEDNKFNVNYFGPPFSYKIVPFVDVINKNFEPNTFKDKIVLIGVTSFQEIQDKVLTPKSTTTAMSGIEFRANEIQTILDNQFLKNQSELSQILTLLILSVALGIAFNYIGIILSFIIGLFSIIGYILSARLFYKNGIIINMLYPFFAIALVYIFSWIYRYFIADKGKREIKSAFGHYVSSSLVDEISKNPDMVKLGGEKKVVTIFFSDIKNSTTLAEKSEIISWVSQINEYFTMMESIIKKFFGTVDKYEGDAIMGFWNAPVSLVNHVSLAYTAALEMKKVLKLLHEKWTKENKPLIEFRIGINTGEAIVGNFGSVNRFDYTVMGDSVNTASRLESSANKTYGTQIAIAGFESYISKEDLEKFLTREIDLVFFPGKNEPVKLFELISNRASESGQIQLMESYSKGLNFYRQKDYKNAIAIFEGIKEDSPSKVMLERCKILISGGKIEGLSEEMIFRIANK
ncbi:adenylate/guanylate cyclase domain-containing protein [Candidatus Peregrinibacteria bacterium]|nr:adenylate/guanylate cyclase domain-containing protein [Candidatus Peregrinibacteria bacterium]